MKVLAFIGVVAIVVAVAAGVYFFGGFYNVAGTQKDPALVAWSLAHVRFSSIERHATETPAIDLAIS